mmetsp:Transcript_56365/g.132157  ORF Transcript_56365/g.132157 Transcript_56365/m.132157 type:complete len:442 (-) Transcript_56365:119-1444(-)
MALRTLTWEKNSLTKLDLDEHASRSTSSGGKTRYPFGSDEGDTSGQTNESQSSGGGTAGQVAEESVSRSDPASSEHGSAANGAQDSQAGGCNEGLPPRFACLARDGASESVGSVQHPNGCKPCAFYCFSPQSGCRNGLDCVFCHLDHVSRLRKKKEEWKRTQRERRKNGRLKADDDTCWSQDGEAEGDETLDDEEGDATSLPQRVASGMPVGQARKAGSGSGLPAGQEQDSEAGLGEPAKAKGLKGSKRHPEANSISPELNVFAYNPSCAVVAVREGIWMSPPTRMMEEEMIWAVSPELPLGVHLNQRTGLISGSAGQPTTGAVNYFVTACKPATRIEMVSASIVTLNILDHVALAGASVSPPSVPEYLSVPPGDPLLGEDLVSLLTADDSVGFSRPENFAAPVAHDPVQTLWPYDPHLLNMRHMMAMSEILNGMGHTHGW